MKQLSPGPWTVQPLQFDHGASLAIVDAESQVVAIIPPLNSDDDPDEHTAIRGEFDVANAEVLAAAWEMLAVTNNLVAWSVGKRGRLGDNGSLKLADICEAAESAVAKAKGEPT